MKAASRHWRPGGQPSDSAKTRALKACQDALRPFSADDRRKLISGLFRWSTSAVDEIATDGLFEALEKEANR